MIKHPGKPLQGVTVKVTDAVANANMRSSGVSTAAGSVPVTGLPPVDDWPDVDFLGIGAAYQCFHVAERASPGAKHRVSLEWAISRLQLAELLAS
jgi:hypothetical protein